MLHLLSPLLVLALACGSDSKDSSGDSGGAAQAWSYPLDDLLRLNHAQVIGTHNSYHVEPPDNVVDDWAYTHEDLDVQLGSLGVRQLELDVHFNPETASLEVYHLPIVDAVTTCLAFTDCLCAVRQWSDRSPGHMPLMIAIEPKDELDVEPMVDHLDDVDEAIAAIWPADRLITPDEVRGDAASLGEAVAERGWPTLGALRGRAFFYLLDGGASRDAYSEDLSTLAGRTMFVNAGVGHPLSAVTAVDDPYDEASIAAALDAGLIVRTRADAGEPDPAEAEARLRQALSSGAHYLSTDYPAPVEGYDYVAAIPGGQPAGCNPVLAPGDCAATDIEDPAFISD